MPRKTQATRGMPLFDRDQGELLTEEVRKGAIEALADLLLEARQASGNAEDASDEPEDHA